MRKLRGWASTSRLLMALHAATKKTTGFAREPVVLSSRFEWRAAYVLAASSACCNRDFGCTPTNRSTTSPFLKTINVGMLLTP